MHDVFRTFETSERGLPEDEVKKRLMQYGENSVGSLEHSTWDLFVRQLRSPFIYLLLFATAVSIFLGEAADAMFILLFVVINIVLGFIQEYRSESAVRMLKSYLSHTTTVLRDGIEKDIETRRIVPGDIVVLTPGDVLGADVRLVKVESLIMDESTLTGESVHVSKIARSNDTDRTEGTYADIGYSGTAVLSGKGVGVVVATGTSTAFGKISSLTVSSTHQSIFENNMARFSGFILKLVIGSLFFVFSFNMIIKGDSFDFIRYTLFSIALAVSVIPEALPLVMTFSFSRGAQRLAKRKVVVKRLSAIEDLGSLEVLCTDKTGTLTENKLTVTEMYGDAIISWACAASYPGSRQGREPFDDALETYHTGHGKQLEPYMKIIDHLPFNPITRMSTSLVETEGKRYCVSRGAADYIADLPGISQPEKKKLLDWEHDQSLHGTRVLAVAVTRVHGKATRVIEYEGLKYSVAGAVSFEDPIKATTIDAVRLARQMGVAIKILTGDSRDVAMSVGKKIGLVAHADDVVSGQDLDSADHHTLVMLIKKSTVFARVNPEQKFKIISVLKEYYDTGFLGEGINDAPPLKAAHVALTVPSASDISKDVADIVLLDKDLKVIVEGIRIGREIVANTRKYIITTLASNFGNYFAVAVSTLFIPYLPMLPVQILLLNLLSDFPMIAIATDTVPIRSIARPQHFDLKEIVSVSTVLGIVSSFYDFLIFALFFHAQPAILQTAWFIESNLTELLLIYSVRTRRWIFSSGLPSRPIIIMSVCAIIMTIAVPLVGVGRDIFQFAALDAETLAHVALIVLMYLVSTEIVKVGYFRLLMRDEHSHR